MLDYQQKQRSKKTLHMQEEVNFHNFQIVVCEVEKATSISEWRRLYELTVLRSVVTLATRTGSRILAVSRLAAKLTYDLSIIYHTVRRGHIILAEEVDVIPCQETRLKVTKDVWMNWPFN